MSVTPPPLESLIFEPPFSGVDCITFQSTIRVSTVFTSLFQLDFQYQLSSRLLSLFASAEARLLFDIKSFSNVSIALASDRRETLRNSWLATLTPKLALWLDQFQVLDPLLRSFGEELNSKCYPIGYVEDKKINKLITEKTFQKVFLVATETLRKLKFFLIL